MRGWRLHEGMASWSSWVAGFSRGGIGVGWGLAAVAAKLSGQHLAEIVKCFTRVIVGQAVNAEGQPAGGELAFFGGLW
jgi:hypothetical protein